MQMIPMAASMAMQGQQNANREGGQSGFGTAQSFKNVADPADLFGGSSSKSIFGNIIDPGNVWGMNPDMAGHNANLTGLPTPNGSVNPLFFNPNSFGPRQPLAPGKYNAMASGLAGPQYMPQGGKGASTNPGGGKGASPSISIPRKTMPVLAPTLRRQQ